MTQPSLPNSSASAACEQPMPTHNWPDSVEVTPILLKHMDNRIQFEFRDKGICEGIKEDLIARNELGIRTYGTPLFTFNGRNALLDAYQEMLDTVKYYQQFVMEQGRSLDLTLASMLHLLEEMKSALMQPPVQAE